MLKCAKRHWIELLGAAIALIALLYGWCHFKVFGIIPEDLAVSLTPAVFSIGVNLSAIKLLLDYNEYRQWKPIEYPISRAIFWHSYNIINVVTAANFQEFRENEKFLIDAGLKLCESEPKFGTDILGKIKDLLHRNRISSLEDRKSKETYEGLKKIVDKLIDNVYQNTKWDMDELQKSLIPIALRTPMDKYTQNKLTELLLAIIEFYEIKVPDRLVIPWPQIDHEYQLDILIKIHELASTIEQELNSELGRS